MAGKQGQVTVQVTPDQYTNARWIVILWGISCKLPSLFSYSLNHTHALGVWPMRMLRNAQLTMLDAGGHRARGVSIAVRGALLFEC